MTAVLIHLCERNAVIAADTLAIGLDSYRGTVSKIQALPHLGVLLAMTGNLRVASSLYEHMNGGGFDGIRENHATASVLRRRWNEVWDEQGWCHSTTVFVVGAQHGYIVAGRYRSPDFEPELLDVPSVIGLPFAPGLEPLTKSARGARDYARLIAYQRAHQPSVQIGDTVCVATLRGSGSIHFTAPLSCPGMSVVYEETTVAAAEPVART